MTQTIETCQFSPALLAPGDRLPGVSAFRRIRNSADFLEASIRTHFEFYDEIVAVYNQCTDATPQILARLASELGPKLRVFHYLPRVSPPGSEGHTSTPGSEGHASTPGSEGHASTLGSEGHASTLGDARASMVTYSNFALATTRHQWAVKLDDDYLAIPDAVGRMIDDIRAGRADDRVMHCFSGLNLVRDAARAFHVPAAAPVWARATSAISA
jgi:hypothetical protein